MPPLLADLCIPSLPSGANPLLWPRLALPAALPTSCLFAFRPSAAPPGSTVSPPCPWPPREAGAGKSGTHALFECPCVPGIFLSPSGRSLEPAAPPHRAWPCPASRAGAAGRSCPGSPGTWPALLAAASRARVSEKRWFWGGVTVTWLMGQGTDPPLPLEWPEMLSSSPCFQGTLKLALGQPVPDSPSGLSWHCFCSPGEGWVGLGDKGDSRASLTGHPTPQRGRFGQSPKSPACYSESKMLNHLRGIWWGQYRCDCQHRGSVHGPRPPFPWLCSGPCPSLALLLLMSTLGSPQSGLSPPPSAQLSSGRLIPPPGPRFRLQVAYSIQGCRALSHACPGRCRYIVT